MKCARTKPPKAARANQLSGGLSALALVASASFRGEGGMQQTSRVELIDSLRGFALMGLFLIHCVELFELYWAHPEPGPVFDWVFGLFAGKSYALFALTFGLSFFIIMDSAAKRGVDF